MAYNDLQQNQTISFNNLQSGVAQGVFTAKTTIPSSLKQITKTEANTYVNINTSLPSYAAKASNQLVTKEDLSGITSASPYIMYGVAGTAAYKSIDGGNTFTALSGLTSSYTWTGIAGDITGLYIAVISFSENNQIYISNNGGVSFTATTITFALTGFYPTGVSMSNDGQYIAVSGLTTNIGGLRNALVSASSNYGASFSSGYGDSTAYNMYVPSGKVSVSGNGQYMTAIFSYQVDPGGVNVPRPWSFRVYSSNYGSSWTKSGGSEFSRFFDIALDGTGQNQFLTTDWCRPGVSGSQGIKAYVSNNYGSSFTEKFSNTTSFFFGGSRHMGFVSATISDNGQVMVGSTNETTSTSYYDISSFAPLVISSINSGSSFTSSGGYTNAIEMAGGTAVTTGITNNYVAMMLNNIGQFNYSTNGGSSFLVSSTTARAWNQIYRKALLNTPTTTTSTTTTTTAAPTTTTTTTTAASYTIQWSFSQNANSGNFSISVNSIQVVSVTSTGSGTISISPGDYVETAVGAGASSFLIAQADLLVQDNFITLYNNSTQGYPFAAESFGPYYPSGDGNIDATASEF
jgi:hypothetical protein